MSDLPGASLGYRQPEGQWVYRIGKGTDPWKPTPLPLESRGTGALFRFDDPQGEYTVSYASSQPLGCYLETLGRLRVKPEAMSALSSVAGGSVLVDSGIIPDSWRRVRRLGRARLRGRFADIFASSWLNWLYPRAPRLGYHDGMGEWDAALLHSAKHYPLTRGISRLVYEMDYQGIYYRSRYGHDQENWAIFSPTALSETSSGEIKRDDEFLQRALQAFGLRLAGGEQAQ